MLDDLRRATWPENIIWAICTLGIAYGVGELGDMHHVAGMACAVAGVLIVWATLAVLISISSWRRERKEQRKVNG